MCTYSLLPLVVCSLTPQSTLCQLYDVLHIDTLTSHNLAKVVYKDADLRNTFLQVGWPSLAGLSQTTKANLEVLL